MGTYLLLVASLTLVPFPVEDREAVAKDLAKFQGKSSDDAAPNR